MMTDLPPVHIHVGAQCPICPICQTWYSDREFHMAMHTGGGVTGWIARDDHDDAIRRLLGEIERLRALNAGNGQRADSYYDECKRLRAENAILERKLQIEVETRQQLTNIENDRAD